MYFLIVDTRTNQKYKKPGHYTETAYNQERGAKIACTKLNKSHATTRFVIMTNEQFDYYYPVKMVERVNLMSGQKYLEAEDTPNFCSPASESYWSM